MSDPEKHTKCDGEAKQRTEKILQQLDAGELQGKVKVILITGAVGAGKTSLVELVTGVKLDVKHTLQNGTIHAHCVVTDIDGQRFAFVDTPGFGYPGIKAHQVKESIYKILGMFTRKLGGIHGILYVQSTLSDRTSTGMRESIEFLGDLANEKFHPHITFVTTKWDLLAPKGIEKWRTLVEELKTSEWKRWKVGEFKGARYFENGVGGDDNSQDKAVGKENLLENVMNYYASADLKDLTMPFSQWKFKKQAKVVIFTGFFVTACVVGAELVIVACGSIGLALASGAPIVLSFSVSF